MHARTFLALALILATSVSCIARDVIRRDLLGDPLPEGALARMGTIRLRSDSAVACVAFSADGKTLLTGNQGNKITVWDVASGKPTRQITMTSAGVSALQISQDGKLLAVTGGDSAFRILDAATGAEKKVLQNPTRRNGNLIAFLSPNGKTAVMMHPYDRQVLIWDVESATVKHRMPGVNSYNPPPVVFTPDSKQFITLWSDNTLHLVNVATGKSVRELEPAATVAGLSTYHARISALALTPDGKRLVYRTTADDFFTVMDLAAAKVVGRIGKGFRCNPSSAAVGITPNSRFLVEANDAVRVWGLASGKLLRELPSPSGSIAQLALSRDGKRAAGVSGNCVYLWDVEAGRQLHASAGHQSSPTHLVFTSDGKRLISVGASTIRAWDAETGRELHQCRPYGLYGISWLSTSADGKTVRYISSDRAVAHWRIGAPQPVYLTTPRNVPYYTTYTVSPDGKLLAAINSTDRVVRLIDLLSNKPDRELTTVANAYTNQLIFSPDGRTLVLSAADRSVTFFDVPTASQRRTILPDRAIPRHLAYYGAPTIVFSRDSRTVILLDDGELKVIETVSGGERQSLPTVRFDAPSVLVWSNDGRMVAQGYANGSVCVRDTWTGWAVLRRNGEQGAITSLAFSRDGRKLAVGGANTSILVWEVSIPAPQGQRAALDEEGAWRDLEDIDASRSFRAITRLTAAPAEAVRLFKSRLKPRPPVDARRIGKLIADLDDDGYRVREKASEELAEVGLVAEEALKAAAKSPSAEVKRRAEDLLYRLRGGNGLAPDRLRAQRAVEVLEKIGSPAAKALLRSMLDRKKMRLDPSLEAAVKGSLERLGEGN